MKTIHLREGPPVDGAPSRIPFELPEVTNIASLTDIAGGAVGKVRQTLEPALYPIRCQPCGPSPDAFYGEKRDTHEHDCHDKFDFAHARWVLRPTFRHQKPAGIHSSVNLTLPT